MPTTERDAQALTYLARRLREETYGANTWDDAGIHAVVAELVGQDLAITVERVARHSADPAAMTPGAIRRPFLPDPQKPTRVLDVAPVGTRCTVCGEQEPRCRRLWTGEHEFTQPRPRTTDLAPVVTELKGHIQPAPHGAGHEENTK